MHTPRPGCLATPLAGRAAWEISINARPEKLEAPDDLLAAVADGRFEPLPIRIEHALAAGALPPHHRDPFDRMLVAQARAEALTLVTRDPRITRYDVQVLRA